MSVQQASNGSYVTPFLNGISILKTSCLLRDGFNLAMKNASKFLRVLPSFVGPSNVLILIFKCNHGDFNSHDAFSSNFFVHIVALNMD